LVIRMDLQLGDLDPVIGHVEEYVPILDDVEINFRNFGVVTGILSCVVGIIYYVFLD